MKKLLALGGVIAAFVLIPLLVALTGFSGLGSSAEAATSTYCTTGPSELPERVPEPMNKIFTAAAKQYDVPPYAVALVYFVENRGYREPPPPYGKGAPWPTSYAGASGPFQFMSGTWWAYRNSNPAHQPGNVNGLVDAAYASAHYLADSGAKGNPPFGSASDMYRKGTVIYALAIYNAGSPGNFNNSQTIEYVRLAEEEFRTHLMGKAPPTSQGDTGCTTQITGTATQGYPNTDKLNCLGATKEVGLAKTAKGNVIKLCERNGIVVNASVSERFSLLIDLVAQDGYTIAGSGFRTMESQIALRKAHCGTSDYAIWQMPSMQCHPPTAIPGTSQHEQGLALDLSGYAYGNGIFNSTQRAAADPRVGFVNNVPTEPWHWAAR